MRFLADAGISPRTVQYLRDSGHDVVHVRDLAMQRASDRSIADRARLDGRIASVVIFRLSDERAEAVNRRLEAVLSAQRQALEAGALVLVEDVRYRVRLLPIAR